MNWKQPIPTNLDEKFGTDYLSQDIYIWALLHASNTERAVSLNGKIISLKRGQCYATITHLARRFNKNEKTIKKYLNLLNTLHNALEHDPYPQGIVISVKSYDDVIKMESGLENFLDTEWRTTTERLPTNKSDKNVKNERRESTPLVTSQEEKKKTSSTYSPEEQHKHLSLLSQASDEDRLKIRKEGYGR